LLVSTDFPYSTGSGSMTQGGGGACIAQLAEALDKAGIEVEIVTRKEPDLKSELFDFPIHRTHFYDFGFRESKITHCVPATQKVLELLRLKSFDIIHTHNPTAGLTGIAVSKTSKLPHVMTLHGPWAGVRLRRHTRAVARIIEGTAVRGADFVTCDSEALRQEILDYYAVAETKTITIPNAVDTSFFDPSKATKKEAKDQLDIIAEGKIIFYTGRFVEEKGLPYLLEAFKILAQEKGDAHLLLIGGGFDEAIITQWLSENPGLRDRITIIPYLPYEKMPYAYIASDIFVLPTLAEGMSRSIMEALACSDPVVATNVGGNPELVSDERGIIVPPKDPQALKTALQKLLEDEAICVRMGESGRRFVVENLSVDKRLNSFLEVYRMLMRGVQRK